MASTSSCNSCTAPDNDEMLTCSKCSSQYHFQCSGSDSCVSTSTWQCATCIKVQHNLRSEHNLNTEPASLGTDKGSDATVMQHNKQKDLGDEALPGEQQLLLQQLEEEMCIEKEFLRRKYELLRMHLPSDGSAPDYQLPTAHGQLRNQVDAAHRRRRAPKTRDCLITLVAYLDNHSLGYHCQGICQSSMETPKNGHYFSAPMKTAQGSPAIAMRKI
ncbi:hypothetical protein ACLKA6_014561 [Drosophila palustris]